MRTKPHTARPRRAARSVAILLLLGWLQPGVVAQTEDGDAWTPPTTTDGRPDLQGRWTMATFTPFQRHERFADQEFLTEEEAAELRKLLTAEGTDPLARRVFNEADPERRQEIAIQTKENIHYDNAIWLTEENPKNLSSLRT